MGNSAHYFLLSHSMKRSGIAIRNTVHKTSKAATLYLVGSMIDSNAEFNIKEHQSLATAECTGTLQKRLAREHDIFDKRHHCSHALGRRDLHNKQNGCWLTVIPRCVSMALNCYQTMSFMTICACNTILQHWICHSIAMAVGPR